MQMLELRHGSHFLIDFRIVLHRTGAQRIETRIHAKIIIGEVGIMAHYRQFVTLRQRSILSTLHGCRYLVMAIIVARQAVAFAALLGEFKNQFSV